jgi:two-component system chemotaxis response regulator CheY
MRQISFLNLKGCVMALKVMIVEDSATMRRLLNMGSKQKIKDVEILEAENGQEALEILVEHEDIQLIFLDINMPIMNGKEFLKTIRQEKKYDNIKVVVQTTEASRKEIEIIASMGISGYIIKPYKLDTLHQLIDKLAPVMGFETL